MPEKNIINAHTHTFTSRYVPPYLAKTIAPWPLYYLINTQWIVGLAKRYYSYKQSLLFPDKQNSDDSWNQIYSRRSERRRKTLRAFNFKSRKYLYIPFRVIIFYLSLIAALYSIEFLAWIFGLDEAIVKGIDGIKEWLISKKLLLNLSPWSKVTFVLGVLLFINWSRRAIWFLVKQLFPLFSKITSPKGMELLERYLLMGRFSFYGTQQKVAERALHQMPEGSQMVILPMDMEYMGAGKTKMTSKMLENKEDLLKKGWIEKDFKNTFTYQMRELWDFVQSRRKTEDVYKPFLFLDPRRIAKDGKDFFDCKIVQNRMVLKDCFVKTYMEERDFSGFKIYPALGYYVFDEHLLPIWRYAQENNIPIMTHCVIGVIYYRGEKQKDWNFHPVFKQYYKDKRPDDSFPEPMLLPQTKAVDIQYNFTHPMNYLCLLEERFLREIVKNAESDTIRTLYGFTDENTSLTYTLENIKICLAHYGGEEEWTKFLETDRDVYARSMVTKPDEGINFMENADSEFSWSKINSLWHDTDWYSLISSILMNYNNMYADLSYIISKSSIHPLLTHTLKKGPYHQREYAKYEKEISDNKKAFHLRGRNRLRSHILYGTDFYVVRNHNSDKDLFIQTQNALNVESFDLIARENTHNYLSRT